MSDPHFRNIAIRSLLLILFLWFVTTAAALAALVNNQPGWAKVALCWQIALVPGGALTSIIEFRQKWLDIPFNEWSNLRACAPLLASGTIALTVYYLT